MFLRRRITFLILIGIGLGTFYSWSLITTNQVFQSHDQTRKSSLSNLIDTASNLASKVSIRKLDSEQSVTAAQPLFRENILKRFHPFDPNGISPESKLVGIKPNNGHQGDVNATVLPADAGGRNIPSDPFIGPVKLRVPYKLVHIDLKGSPPRLTYLKNFLRTVSEGGANGILLEVEDMFPFDGLLQGTSHQFHFTKDELQELISTALKYNLEVIPLIQTFGHLEFVLKLEKFRDLREIDAYPQEICPSNDKAWRMVTEIIDQVLSLHWSDSGARRGRKSGLPNYIHIGCDEVYHIGECEKCKEKPGKDLFLNHVIRVATYITKRHGITSIMWDDMLRKYYLEDLIKSGIGAHVELMMWDYTEDVDRLLSPYLWPMYTQVFPNIWVASAYKGAFGETLHKVDLQRHALNQVSWLRVLARESSKIRNLRGVALTGWSRYDHFAVLCELLPVAIPSLLFALQLWVHQDYGIARTNLLHLLKCDEGWSLAKVGQCEWDGSDLASAITTLDYYQGQTTQLVRSHRYEKGWMTYYNVKHNYTSPWRLTEVIQQSSHYLSSLRSYESTLRTLLAKYFPEFVVIEWSEQKMESLEKELSQLLSDAQALERRRSWEQRPVTQTPIQKPQRT